MKKYASTFIYDIKQLDEEYHQLDSQIEASVQQIKGYLGKECWENKTQGLLSVVYYWDSLEALQQLVNNPQHLKAKQQHTQWLNNYKVIIAEVIREYGHLEHISK
jgi:heme-degrading monooxygenase HmoA